MRIRPAVVVTDKDSDFKLSMMNRIATLSILLAALMVSCLSHADASVAVTVQISVNLLPDASQEPQIQNCAVSVESTPCETNRLSKYLHPSFDPAFIL
jgi:hypothetical protein